MRLCSAVWLVHFYALAVLFCTVTCEQHCVAAVGLARAQAVTTAVSTAGSTADRAEQELMQPQPHHFRKHRGGSTRDASAAPVTSQGESGWQGTVYHCPCSV